MKSAVIGDFMLDVNCHCVVERISPEAPVPVAKLVSEKYFLGGAANVAVNLRGLGSDVDFYSLIGNDYEDLVSELLNSQGINSFLVKDSKRKTTIKKRILAQNSQILRVDQEETHELEKHFEDEILASFTDRLANYDFVILSDYSKGLVTERISREIISLCNLNDIKTYVDPKTSDFSKYNGAYLIKPNEKEAGLACGFPVQNKSYDALKYLSKFSSSGIGIFTAGADGVYAYDKQTDKLEHFSAIDIPVYDVTGAGDTFISVLAFSQALGYDFNKSLSHAIKGSSIVIQRLGCSSVSRNDILTEETSKDNNRIFFSAEELKRKLEAEHEQDRIVFTNGCFDILHVGHLSYLNASKKLGKVLVVGLNSDKSVQRLKGNSRPINKDDERAEMLLGLQAVDYVVVFEEDTPEKLLEVLQPDVLTKGKDYKINEVVGRNHAKEVVLIDFIPAKSTSLIIQKLEGNEKTT